MRRSAVGRSPAPGAWAMFPLRGRRPWARSRAPLRSGPMVYGSDGDVRARGAQGRLPTVAPCCGPCCASADASCWPAWPSPSVWGTWPVHWACWTGSAPASTSWRRPPPTTPTWSSRATSPTSRAWNRSAGWCPVDWSTRSRAYPAVASASHRLEDIAVVVGRRRPAGRDAWALRATARGQLARGPVDLQPRRWSRVEPPARRRRGRASTTVRPRPRAPASGDEVTVAGKGKVGDYTVSGIVDTAAAGCPTDGQPGGAHHRRGPPGLRPAESTTTGSRCISRREQTPMPWPPTIRGASPPGWWSWTTRLRRSTPRRA